MSCHPRRQTIDYSAPFPHLDCLFFGLRPVSRFGMSSKMSSDQFFQPFPHLGCTPPLLQTWEDDDQPLLDFAELAVLLSAISAAFVCESPPIDLSDSLRLPAVVAVNVAVGRGCGIDCCGGMRDLHTSAIWDSRHGLSGAGNRLSFPNERRAVGLPVPIIRNIAQVLTCAKRLKTLVATSFYLSRTPCVLFCFRRPFVFVHPLVVQRESERPNSY